MFVLSFIEASEEIHKGESANPQIVGLGPQVQIPQISEICESANFKSANFF